MSEERVKAVMFRYTDEKRVQPVACEVLTKDLGTGSVEVQIIIAGDWFATLAIERSELWPASAGYVDRDLRKIAVTCTRAEGQEILALLVEGYTFGEAWVLRLRPKPVEYLSPPKTCNGCRERYSSILEKCPKCNCEAYEIDS